MGDIVIRGMEMPKGCWWYDDDLRFHECKLAKVCPYHLNVGLYDDEYPDAEKSENCPLVELPEPHGRLTDADAFKAYIEKGLELIHRELSGIGLKIAVAVTNSFLKDIDEAPTVLEASE